MTVRVDVIDAESERDLDEVATLLTAYWREVLGDDEPARPGELVRAGMRTDRDDIDKRILVARDGDTPIGFASVDIRVGNGNEHMAWVEDLFVLPPHRRRGTGRRLRPRGRRRRRRATRSWRSTTCAPTTSCPR